MRIRFLLLAALLAVILIAVGSTSLAPAMAAGTGLRALPFRPVNPNYAAIKAQIDANAPRGVSGPVSPLAGPAVFVNANGQPHDVYSPSDSNGAISPTEYIETVNESVGVFDRTLKSTSTNGLVNWSGGNCNTGDPVVMYSAADQRFYVTCIHNVGSSYTLGYGWSKTSTPTASATDWCFYSSNFGGRYGSNLPDYPKLGDMKQALLIGVNVFAGAAFYIGSDVAVVQKPPVGPLSNCSFTPKTTTFQNLKNKDGTQAATPNPMKQADQAAIGVVLANEDAQTSTHLTAYQVSVVGGLPKISAPVDEPVPSYSYPPSAPQKGTADTLDTLDSRLMSGWFYKDPSQGNAYCVISGHTVAASAGGLGTEFRWYEFCAPNGAMVNSGKVQNASRYVFMGAIAPNRNALTGLYGDKWLATVNTSSSTMYVTVSAASAGGMTDIFSSTAPDTDFTCNPVCRWGDYSGASPDPASTTVGQVWGTAMMSMSGSPGWGTWNFGAQP